MNFGNAAAYYYKEQLKKDEVDKKTINFEDVEITQAALINENSAIYKKKKGVRRSENNRSRESNFQNDDINLGSYQNNNKISNNTTTSKSKEQLSAQGSNNRFFAPVSGTIVIDGRHIKIERN